MKIVVCVKQVYDTSQLKFDDATGEMRPGAELIINPFDEYALETALRIKEALSNSDQGTPTIIALSMGNNAKDVLKKALAMGADEAFVLDDPAFEGSDSSSTATALAAAIRHKIPDVQLILAGQSAAEGASGATGPQLAEALDLPCLTFVKEASTDSNTIQAKREIETGMETAQMTLPGVICTIKCDYEPRMANIKGVMKANRAEIPSLTVADLGLDTNQVGAAGAKTAITGTMPRPKRATVEKLEGLDGNAAADAIVNFLKTRQLV